MFEVITLTFGAAFLLGLSFGAGPCSVTCLPFLGPMFVQGNSGWHARLNILLPFTLGRLAGYATLGMVAGSIGYAATELLPSQWAALILGVATIVAGLMLLRRVHTGHKSCGISQQATKEHSVPITSDNGKVGRTTDLLSRFFMGYGLALNPCLPLATVLTAAAATATWHGGLSLGLSFGFGAVVVPTVVYAVLVAHIGEQIKAHAAQWRTSLERSAAVMLIALGSLTIGGYIQV